MTKPKTNDQLHSIASARITLLKLEPCMDCVARGNDGIWPPEVIDLDYLEHLLDLRKYDLLDVEIGKGAVLCANCRIIRTLPKPM